MKIAGMKNAIVAVVALASGGTGGVPPADAIVLIGGRDDLGAWRQRDGGPATWKIANGVAETGKGIIQTKQEFSDFQLHVEFATPSVVKGDSQDRGNSGVFLLGAFEIQVLDSYRSEEHTSELQSHSFISYAVFCLKKK